ncbi:BAD_collapsed_G0043310.mRNA.1.CDS.1 [Saccharomyces cerevisiae]|nr:BAD_HP_G0043200.mRNA.1.CDS.1 [Saccharomyces cerevisiae]CAI6746893.1 BAD_HP_G0043200.mRNA.1.CDS.1 [Saccharomyces cerevisiae]CAI7434363.1 BAD_collapsed_G0043310.mRNA.1.CDS.1 [Saccharomyces cerevisiae]
MVSSLASNIILALVVVLMTLLRQNKPLQKWFVSYVEKLLSRKSNLAQKVSVLSPSLKLVDVEKSISADQSNLSKINYQIPTLPDLTGNLIRLHEYRARGEGYNGLLFRRARQLNGISEDQLQKLGYFTKLMKNNEGIRENARVIDKIIEFTLGKLIHSNEHDEEFTEEIEKICAEHGYKIKDGHLIQLNPDFVFPIVSSRGSQSVVHEALAHLCRDFSSYYSVERDPLQNFIISRINHHVISAGDMKEKILIVTPGAGVGGLSHTLATTFPKIQVDSIELSALMYICNLFALEYKHDVKIRPFVQQYSCQTVFDNQLRSLSADLSKVGHRSNLDPLWGDFTRYSPISKDYDKIIICSAYFIDTAENMFEYLSSVEALKKYCKELHWVNVGPLKYGTKPLVQFTGDELSQLRKIRGWKDLVEEYEVDSSKGLNGYLTDYESMYQGYYGLLKFHSVFES